MRFTALPAPGPSRRLAVFLFVALLVATSSPGQPPTAPPTPSPDALGPVTGAIYLDPWQLEKEIVVSPLALQQWLDLGLTPDSRLDKAQRDALIPRIGDFLALRCPVLIDGDEIAFTLDRVQFIEPNDQEFALIEDDAVVAVAEVRISAIYATPNADPEQPLQLIWNLFPDGVDKVPVTVADDQGARIFRPTRGTPTVIVSAREAMGARDIPPAPPAPVRVTLDIPWLSILLVLCAIPVVVRVARNRIRRPLGLALLLVLAAAAASVRNVAVFPLLHPFDKADAIEPEQTAVIIDHLLRGVYHSFDYRDRDKQYDVLAGVVAGDALETIFLEVQRTLETRQRDGARVRVRDLAVEESTPHPLAGRRGFESECAWEVRGRVGHWGHFHDRINRYRATFTIEPIEETWKITGLTLHARDREPEPTS